MRSSRSGSSELCRAAMGIGVFYIASKTGICTGGQAGGRPREKPKVANGLSLSTANGCFYRLEIVIMSFTCI